MSIAQTVPIATTWAGGWWIVMPVMMVLCMGAMMFGMSRMRRGSARGWFPPWERSVTKETPLETLERRFAEGEISIDDYQARRDALSNGGIQPNGAHRAPAAPRAGGGRQS